MEWQIRCWPYFVWLSGDHIVEQHMHNMDILNWAIGTHPVSCLGFGGRQVRIDTLFGGDELGWSAVLQRKKQFQARALESVEALVFEVSRMHDAFEGNPYFGRAFLERLATVVAERLQNTRLQLAAALAETQAPAKPSS